MTEFSLNVGLVRKLFNVPGYDGLKESDTIMFDVEDIKRKDNDFSLYLKLTDSENQIELREVFLNEDKVSLIEASFLALCLATFSHSFSYIFERKGDDFSSCIGELLSKAMFSDEGKHLRLDSVLPFYVLAKNPSIASLEPFKWNNIQLDRRLMMVLDKDFEDIFPDFYLACSNLQNLSTLKEVILKRGIEKFPNDLSLTKVLSNDYYLEHEYEKCRDLIVAYQGAQKYKLYKRLFECYLSLKSYDEAGEVLSKILNDGYLETTIFYFDSGLLEYRKGDFKAAIRLFYASIETDLAKDYHFYDSLIYLMSCFLKLKDFPKFEKILNDFLLSGFEEGIITIWEEAILIFESALKCNFKNKSEYAIYKVLACLYYRIFNQENPYFDEMVPRKKTKKETEDAKKGLIYLNKAFEFFPNDKFLSDWAVTFYLVLDNHEEALKHNLVQEFPMWSDYISLEKCSFQFMKSLCSLIGESKNRINFEGMFLEDEHLLDYFWEHKMYQSVVDLYKLIIEQIDSEKVHKSIDLFKVAYSFKEIGENKNAKLIYEVFLKANPKSSSALNNLAMIYKYENNITKATLLIKEAKENNPEDEIVLRNFEDLIGKNENKGEIVVKRGELQQDHDVLFDKTNGFLSIDGERKAEFKLATAQFIFMSILYDNSNQPVSHQQIAEAIRGGGISQSHLNKTPQQIANRLKSDIKTKSLQTIDQIISNAKTRDGLNAYMLKRKLGGKR